MSLTIVSIKILSIFIVALGGICGSCAPVLFAYYAQESKAMSYHTVQFISKIMTCLSVGVIITTALVHVFSDGVVLLQESGGIFDDPSFRGNGTKQSHEEHAHHPYPFAALFVVVTICFVYFLSTEINWFGVRKLRELTKHACDDDEEEELAAKVEVHILVTGVAVHSVILGLTLGVSSQLETARVLLIVLVLDCFFDAIAIGNLINTAQLQFWWHGFGLVMCFAFSAPLGIGIGMGLRDNASVMAQGVLSCVSAGLLLNMALVDMLPHALGSHSHHAHGPVALSRNNNNKKNGNGASSSKNDDDNRKSSRRCSALSKRTSPIATPKAKGGGGDADEDDHKIECATVVFDGKTEDEHNNEPTTATVETATTAEAVLEENGSVNEDDEDTKSVIVDHHGLDDSVLVRICCYAAICVGCAIQSALRVYE